MIGTPMSSSLLGGKILGNPFSKAWSARTFQGDLWIVSQKCPTVDKRTFIHLLLYPNGQG